MEVLKTTSPKDSPGEPQAKPSKTDPSSSARVHFVVFNVVQKDIMPQEGSSYKDEKSLFLSLHYNVRRVQSAFKPFVADEIMRGRGPVPEICLRHERREDPQKAEVRYHLQFIAIDVFSADIHRLDAFIHQRHVIKSGLICKHREHKIGFSVEWIAHQCQAKPVLVQYPVLEVEVFFIVKKFAVDLSRGLIVRVIR